MVQKSLSCLKASLTNNKRATLSNTYTTSLMAYVFTLAGDMETKHELLSYLDSVAVNDGKPDLEVKAKLILSSVCAKPISCFLL